MNKYVHVTYSVKKLKAAYAGYIPHITDKQQWPVVDKGFKVFPPAVKEKKGPSRTKKKRHLSYLERSGKATRQVICKSCGEPGHRATSWRCRLTGTKKRYLSFAWLRIDNYSDRCSYLHLSVAVQLLMCITACLMLS
jgi:hypothetical protein